MKKIVSEQLKKLGVPVHNLGYEYLREAILLVIKDRMCLHEANKNLYPEVGKLFNVPANRVYFRIRGVIEKAFIYGDNKEWDAIQLKKGDYSFNCPSNSEFIAYVSDYIDLNWSEQQCRQ